MVLCVQQEPRVLKRWEPQQWRLGLDQLKVRRMGLEWPVAAPAEHKCVPIPDASRLLTARLLPRPQGRRSRRGQQASDLGMRRQRQPALGHQGLVVNTKVVMKTRKCSRYELSRMPLFGHETKCHQGTARTSALESGFSRIGGSAVWWTVITDDVHHLNSS